MTLNADKHIVILGAGPAGLASAYFYNKLGYKVTIIEKSNVVGGLSRTVRFIGDNFDLGPHSFYSNYSSITKTFFEYFIGQDDYDKIKVTKLVQSGKALFSVPFSVKDIFYANNFSFFIGHGFYKLLSKVYPFQKSNSIQKKHGIWIQKKIFAPYCRKYFNLSEEEVSSDFVNLLYSFRKENNEDRIYITRSGYIGELWEKVHAYLLENGIEILFNQTIKTINVVGDSISELTTDSEVFFEIHQLVSTIPLQSLYQTIFSEKEFTFNLKFRASVVVMLQVDEIRSKALYLTNYNIGNLIGRVSFSSNWKIHNLSDKKVISVEIWCDTTDEIYTAGNMEVKEKVIKSLSELSFLTLSENAEFEVIKIPKCYPVLHKGYASELIELKKQFDAISNLKLLGRHGNFHWDGIDDSIMNAYKIANG